MWLFYIVNLFSNQTASSNKAMLNMCGSSLRMSTLLSGWWSRVRHFLSELNPLPFIPILVQLDFYLPENILLCS